MESQYDVCIEDLFNQVLKTFNSNLYYFQNLIFDTDPYWLLILTVKLEENILYLIY